MRAANNPKVLGILLNFTAIGMVLLALYNPEVLDEFNIYFMAAFCALVPGVLLMLGKVTTATLVSRIVVGSVFVVSGLIKANDPVGFGIKLEEYFDENALGAFWVVFHDYALAISLLVSGVEVLLGLALLYGAQARLVSLTLLGMTIFFGWLTWFTASCNDAQMAAMAAGEAFERVCVTDCGCFGDAMRGSVGRSLTPWESFYKDLGLFFMVVVIVYRAGQIKVNSGTIDLVVLPSALAIMLLFGGWLFGWMFPTYFFIAATLVYLFLRRLKLSETRYEWVLAGALAILTYGFAIYTYRHLPIKDFRPYAIGKNINEQMKSASELGLKPTIYANMYRLKHDQTGEEMAMNSKEYLDKAIWKDENWKIVYTSPNPVLIERGYEPPIASFNIMDQDGFDIGEDLINDENYSLAVVTYKVERATTGRAIEQLRALAAAADKAGLHMYALTSSGYDATEDFRHKHQLPIPFYTGDEVLLKTIIRSNPGLVLLRRGTIVHKWHANDLPSWEELQKKYMK